MTADEPGARGELEAIAFGRSSTPDEREAAVRSLRLLQAGDERRARDQAIVFGRSSTPEERAAAAESLRALQLGAERTESETVHPDDSGPAVEPEAIIGDTRSESPPGRSALRRFWVIPVVIASLAVGAVGGSLATSAVRGSAGPSAFPTAALDFDVARPDAQEPAGDAGDGTGEWLSRPATARDSFPDEGALDSAGMDSSTVRQVTSGGGTSVWVARGTNDSVCILLFSDLDGSSASSCTSRKSFANQGLSIDSGAASAHWDPTVMSFTPPMG